MGRGADDASSSEASGGPETAQQNSDPHFLCRLQTYLAAMYLGCPSKWRESLVRRAAQRGTYGRLGEVAGILVSNSIRHRATDYERLMRINGDREGLTREEARMVVAQEVEDQSRAWRVGSAETDPGYVALRRRSQKKRKRGAAKGFPAGVLIAAENAELSEYLRDWLAARETTSSPPMSRQVPTLILRRSMVPPQGADGPDQQEGKVKG